jgi:hypothetical protein
MRSRDSKLERSCVFLWIGHKGYPRVKPKRRPSGKESLSTGVRSASISILLETAGRRGISGRVLSREEIVPFRDIAIC